MNNQKELKRQRIVLAALLHDIGKFWQRADAKYSESDVLNAVYINKTYDMTVPLYPNSNYPKYTHALWTNAFFEKTKTGNKFGLSNKEDKTIGNLSANHHKPNNHEEAIIALADRMSSGIDRPDEGEEGVSSYTEVKGIYKDDFVRKVAMHSIFDIIHRSYEDIKERHHTYPIAPLNLSSETLFPIDRLTDSLQEDYKKLWNSFYKEYLQLIGRAADFNAYFLSLLTLLKEYTWCIPSATNLLPSNVSLYEHLKSTAAIALSLYDYCEAYNKELGVNENHKITNLPQNDALLMVCVDVSGIQKFIYDIANKKAAASLKGRSFYIELLIQNIIDEILNHEDIKAYRSNIIYSSGGKAYLILPNVDKVKAALESIQNKIAENLFNETEGRLFVSIGYTSFRYNSYYGDITNGKYQGQKGYINKLETDETHVLKRYEVTNDNFDLSILWRSVSDKAAERKNRKFEQVFVDKFDDLFYNGEDFVEGQKKCAVMGTPIKGVPIVLDKSTDEDSLYISKLVNDQINIGKDLRTSSKITYHADNNYHSANLGNRFNLTDSNHDDTRLIHLNTWPNFSRHKGGQGHLFYGGNYQPSTGNRSKTFEELATTDKGESTKLAVLRMDVDDLGQIFISGIQDKSFAAYATLSMMLDIFFAGYINTLQSENDKFKNHVQILYSGGDDVFAVGRWDAIIDFARDTREAFRAFVCRDDISISAGIAIVSAKYPISKAAQDAGEAEKRAKVFNGSANKFTRPLKDAIDVFGQTIGWGREWKEVDTLRKSFEYFESDTGRALIHSIQRFKLRKDENVKHEHEGKEKDLSYIWHSAYQLSRLMERLKKKQEAHDFTESIRDRVLHDKEFGSERFLDIAAVAARWAEYNLKDSNK